MIAMKINFKKSLLDRYVHRRQELEEMSYAEFGANYTVGNSSISLKKIKLTDNFGTMHKRTREAIIRFHKPNKEKNPQDFFRMKLMLYLPWRNETSYLLGGYQDYYSYYASCEDIVIRNDNKYTADVDDLKEYLQQLNKSGPPQHIWSTVAPTSEQNRFQEEEGFKQLTNLEEDLQPLRAQPPGSIVTQLHARYEPEANKQELSAEEYQAMMGVLNKKTIENCQISQMLV